MPGSWRDLGDKILSDQRDLFAARDRQAEEIADITDRLRKLERKSRGATSAHRKIVALQQRLEVIESRSDSEVSESLKKELDRIDSKTWELHLEIDKLNSKVAGLTTAESSIDFLRSKIDIVHSATIKVITPWLEAVIAGVFAGLAFSLMLNYWLAVSWSWKKDLAACVIIAAAFTLLVASFEKFDINLDIQARHLWAKKAESDVESEEKLDSLV